MKDNITGRIELLLAKIAGRDVDLSTMTPSGPMNLSEKLMLDIADRVDIANAPSAESVSENAHVLIEDGGTVKKTAVSNIGGGGDASNGVFIIDIESIDFDHPESDGSYPITIKTSPEAVFNAISEGEKIIVIKYFEEDDNTSTIYYPTDIGFNVLDTPEDGYEKGCSADATEINTTDSGQVDVRKIGVYCSKYETGWSTEGSYYKPLTYTGLTPLN